MLAQEEVRPAGFCLCSRKQWPGKVSTVNLSPGLFVPLFSNQFPIFHLSHLTTVMLVCRVKIRELADKWLISPVINEYELQTQSN